jgi:enamine deaminase RidA (YjgF/YER057c/UK114 family)
MPTQRLRKFNQTQMRYYDGQRLTNDMCMIVIADGHVFLRGQTGHDMQGGQKITLGDAAAQADQAMQNVKVLLAEAGARLEDVVKVTVWVTDRDHRVPVMNAIGKHLKGVHAAYTDVIIKGLALPELLMEVDVDAVLP